MPPGVRYITAVLVAAAAAGCGGGGGTSSATGSGGSRSACTLVSRLDTVAAGVRTARVDDPAAFKRTLDDAVTRYRDTLRELRSVAPATLGSTLERVEADVSEYRFEAARLDRTPLDAYAQRECGRPIPGTPTTVPASTP